LKTKDLFLVFTHPQVGFFKNPSEDEVNMISGKINSSSSLTNTIADTLSNLTHHAGLILIPKIKKTTFKHIEFINLSKDKVLAILVTSDGQVTILD